MTLREVATMQPNQATGEERSMESLDIARIAIPAIGVENPVGRYGIDRFGRLDIPQDTSTVGWNPAYNALPGEGAYSATGRAACGGRSWWPTVDAAEVPPEWRSGVASRRWPSWPSRPT